MGRLGAALLQIVSKGKDEFEAKEIKAYRNSQLNNHHGGMVLVDGHVYFGHDRNGGGMDILDAVRADLYGAAVRSD